MLIMQNIGDFSYYGEKQTGFPEAADVTARLLGSRI